MKTCGCLVGQTCKACCPVTAEVVRAVGDGPYTGVRPDDVAYITHNGGTECDPYYTGRARDALATGYKDPSAAEFVLDVLAEVFRARAKFGGQSSELTGLALAEELSEVHLAVALGACQAIKRLLHIKEGKSGEDDLYTECVQVAAMALRLALESDDRREWPGNVKFPRRAD